VPTAAVEAAVSVKVEVPEPGVASEEALNAAVTPVGNPDALRAIAELKPPETAVAMVLVPLIPCATVTDAGDAEMVNAGKVIRSERAEVCVTPPPVPVTVTI